MDTIFYTTEVIISVKVDFMFLLIRGEYDKIRRMAAIYTDAFMEEVFDAMPVSHRLKIKEIIAQ